MYLPGCVVDCGYKFGNTQIVPDCLLYTECKFLAFIVPITEGLQTCACVCVCVCVAHKSVKAWIQAQAIHFPAC